MTESFEENLMEQDLVSWAEKQRHEPDPIWMKFFDSMEDPAFLQASDGTILMCNRVSEDFLGLSRDEIIGRHCYEVVHKMHTFIENCPFVKSRKTRKREKYLIPIENRWFRISVDPIFNKEGNFIGALHIATDVHDMLESFAEKARLGNIVKNTNDAVIESDPVGVIRYVNPGAIRLLGYSAGEIQGKQFSIVLDADSDIDPAGYVKTLESGGSVVNQETKLVAKGGEKREVTVSISPVYDEREVFSGVSYVATDLTRQRLAEKELLAYLTEYMLRMKKPLEIMKNNIEDLSVLFEEGVVDQEDVKQILSVQVKNAEKVLENLGELNRAVVGKQKDLSEEYRDFLTG